LRDALEGKTRELEKHIEEEIQNAVDRMAFEYAATLRDRLLALRKVQRLRGGSLPTTRVDILVVHAEKGWALAMILRWEDDVPRKEGLFQFNLPPGTDNAELIRTIVETLYLHRPDLPHVLVLDPMPDPEDREVLEKILGLTLRGAHVEEQRILHTARETLRFEVQQLLERRKRLPRSLEELQTLLDLPSPPVRIEAVDLSHLSGREPVASVVVFERGRPRRNAYRRYRIRQAPGGDDYAGMGEVVYRRLVRLMKENQPLPDLLLVDGGIGQVRAARLAARRAGIPDEDLPIVGLAKRLELLIREDGARIQLPGRNPALQLLQRVRNEAHRFARTYQTVRRKKAALTSVLDQIPGVGEARKRLLLRHFGSVDALRGASLKDLQRVPGIGPRLARTIYEGLHRD
jgi:excinuclease ABC subunit C